MYLAKGNIKIKVHAPFYTHLYFAKRQQKKTIKAKNKKRQNNKKSAIIEQRT